jgi:hypothetical protein
MLPVVEVRQGPSRVSGPVRPADSEWSLADHFRAWSVRWGIGRMKYEVDPGLYALNSPDGESPVVVSANYKLSFDILRRALAGKSAWILVLDTAGINVWCAAGKGTFGTDELIRRMEETRLGEVVAHRRIILPQLGGPGVAGHAVREETGFRVVFGPVRADDLPAFLDAGLKADRAMRLVTFTFRERMALVPMELVPAFKWSLLPVMVLLAAGGFGAGGFSASSLFSNGRGLLLAWADAVAAGAVVTPALLPLLPGRSFSFKGFLPGILWAVILALPGLDLAFNLHYTAWDKAAWFLGLPAISAFLAMNFTGSAVSTSLSGVRKEMRYALPLQLVGASAGAILWLAGHFLGGRLS